MTFTEKVQKTNWLNELRLLVIAAAVVVAGFTAVEVIQVTAGGGEVVAELVPTHGSPQQFQLGGQELRQLATEVAIVKPTGAQVAWHLTAKLPTAIVVLAVLLILLRMLTRARRANPFTRATVNDLRWAAVILIGGGSLAGVLETIAGMGLTNSLPAGHATATWRFPVLWFLMGAGVLAVSEIVARGRSLREELDEVI